MDNYPPGFDPKSLEDPTANIELPEEQRAVKYELKVYCGEGEELVYSSDFGSEESLQEEGLRKAEHAIDEWQTKELDYLIDAARDREEE